MRSPFDHAYTVPPTLPGGTDLLAVARCRVRAAAQLPGQTRLFSSSGGQATSGLLHRGQRHLCVRQRPSPHVNARRLSSDLDLLTGCRVATLTLLLSRLHTDRQLNEPADPNLLRVPKLLEHDLIQRGESPLRVASAHVRTLGDCGDQLRLCNGNGFLHFDRAVKAD